MTSERHLHLRGMKLTSIDLEMLQFLAEGCSNEEIAQLTGRSIETIKHRAVRLYARLGVSNRAQAVATLYRKEDLVTTSEDDNKQLRATVAGLRAKVSELQDKLTAHAGCEEMHQGMVSALQASERELAELKKLLTTTAPPAAWLDSTQGRL